DFEVKEPVDVKATVRGLDGFAPSQQGAGMYLDVVLQPTTVSFSRVQILEPYEPTINISGYFLNTNHPAINHDGDHGSGEWHPVNCKNLVVHNVFDHAWSQDWPRDNGSWSPGGTYTWPIHPIWAIDGAGKTNPLNGWTSQEHILNGDGTMTIKKLHHS